MDRYIGLDAHASSCTVAVIGTSGRKLQHQVIETNAKALITFIRTVPRNRRLIRRSRGPKSDKIDAFALAEKLRIGDIETRVYKKRGEFAALGHLTRAYGTLTVDVVRTQNRIKSLLRSRGIPTGGKRVYSASGRQEWLAKLPAQARCQTDLLYCQYDALADLCKRAEKQMLTEARKHTAYKVIKTCPGPTRNDSGICSPC